LAAASFSLATGRADTYSWTNLQSDIAGVATHLDRNLVNPWGMAVSPNGTIWVSAADRVCSLLGVEMALTKGGSPASDWHQGNVDVRYLVESKVRTRVPRIPTPARALDEIAERGPAMRASRVSPAVVVGGQDAYP